MVKAAPIKTYHFLPYKYGTELLLDLGRIATLKNYLLDRTLHQVSFYEIVFIEEGSGTFSLEEKVMSITAGTIIFISPGRVRRWEIKEKIRGYKLFFELIIRKPDITVNFIRSLQLLLVLYFKGIGN
jgi:hypothetical protein